MTDQDLLVQANVAYHKLLTGTSAIEVDMGTHRVKFTPADSTKLVEYIAKLETRIAGNRPQRGAIGFVF